MWNWGRGLLNPHLTESSVPSPLSGRRIGDWIVRGGVEAPSLDREKKWEFVPGVKPGDKVETGDIVGIAQETSIVEYRVMVPPGVQDP